MGHSRTIVDTSACTTLDTIWGQLADARHVVIGLGDGHVPLHVERPGPHEGILCVAHYLEGGSRREGWHFTPAPEMVFSRTSAGWRPLSLRDIFLKLTVTDAKKPASVTGTMIEPRLVDFADAWLENVRRRLALVARRAA